jgi:hypothetical protein
MVTVFAGVAEEDLGHHTSRAWLGTTAGPGCRVVEETGGLEVSGGTLPGGSNPSASACANQHEHSTGCGHFNGPKLKLPLLVPVLLVV